MLLIFCGKTPVLTNRHKSVCRICGRSAGEVPTMYPVARESPACRNEHIGVCFPKIFYVIY